MFFKGRNTLPYMEINFNSFDHFFDCVGGLHRILLPVKVVQVKES